MTRFGSHDWHSARNPYIPAKWAWLNAMLNEWCNGSFWPYAEAIAVAAIMLAFYALAVHIGISAIWKIAAHYTTI